MIFPTSPNWPFKGVFHTINPYNLTGLGNYTLYVEMTDFDFKKKTKQNKNKKKNALFILRIFLNIMATYLLIKKVDFICKRNHQNALKCVYQYLIGSLRSTRCMLPQHEIHSKSLYCDQSDNRLLLVYCTTYVALAYNVCFANSLIHVEAIRVLH